MSKFDLSPRRCVMLRHLAFEDLGFFESELQPSKPPIGR